MISVYIHCEARYRPERHKKVGPPLSTLRTAMNLNQLYVKLHKVLK